jgi:hypothetical protein
MTEKAAMTPALLTVLCVQGLDSERTCALTAGHTDQLNFFTDMFNSEVTGYSAVVLDDALSHDDEDLFDAELKPEE